MILSENFRVVRKFKASELGDSNGLTIWRQFTGFQFYQFSFNNNECFVEKH